MLFQVEMDVEIPSGVDPVEAARLKADEKARFQELQLAGKWRHLWRVVGRYANVSIFDVDSNVELHDILSGLPLFRFMTLRITALCRHPSSAYEDDR